MCEPTVQAAVRHFFAFTLRNVNKGCVKQRAKKMLLLLCAVVIGNVYVFARAQSVEDTKITIGCANQTLDQALQLLKNAANVNLYYMTSDVQPYQSVTLEKKTRTVKETLQLLLSNTSLSYKVEGNKIMFTNSRKPALIDASLPMADTVTLRGRVTNEEGKPLEGVAVQLKNTTKGTITNSNGDFELRAGGFPATLLFSFIGYEKTELIANNSINRIKVELKGDGVNTLDETIIKGYYNTSKRLNTGSVSKVSSEILQKQPVSNVLAALEGRVSGLYIQQSSGVPGASLSVKLRGQNSLRIDANDPLFVVDGIYFPSTSMAFDQTSGLIYRTGTSPLNGINMSDVESIEVLKDADATAIYGSKGANGVILITTKKGKIGKTKFELNFYQGVGTVARKMKLLDSKQYLQMRREGFLLDGVTPNSNNAQDLFAWDTTRYTDWQKELIGGTAIYSDAQASISGGTANSQYLFGGGFHKETTVFPGDNSNKKGAVHFNYNASSDNNKFKLALTTNYLVENSNLLNQDLTTQAVSLAPIAPALYDSVGGLNWQNSTWTNPLSYTRIKYSAQTNNLISNLQLSYLLLPELQIKANLGYTNIYSKALTKTPISSYNPAIAAFVQNQSAFSNTTYKALIIEPQLSWSKRVERHSFDILAGMTFQNDVRDGIAESATGFSSEALMDNIKAANNILIAAYNYSKYKYSAFFGRFNYDYKKKYLVNITARRDGSSRFGPGKQFANFGAIGVGWIFSSEEWLNKYLSVLSFGKLRASLGTTGNDQIGDYAFLDTYSPSGQYQGVNGLNPSRLFNPDFAWETSKKMEVAFELGFLRDRIMLNVNYYRNKSSNQLVGYPLAPTTGFSSVQYNLPATIENTGVEFELSTVNINSKKVTWKSSINITIPRNKLIEFPNLSGSSFANQYVVGQSLNIKKVYRSLGVDKQTGVYTFEDVDKNNILNSVDQQTTKFVGQNFYGGLANTFKYNKLQIDIMFQFVKQTGNNYLVTGFTLPGTAGNKPVFVLDDHWKKPNDAATIQRFTAGNYAPAYSNRSYLLNSDLSITDASFIRLKNLSISYDIDRQTFSKFPLQLMKLFIQCQNLITITGYKGLDPENQNATRLPPLRVLTAGVQVIL